MNAHHRATKTLSFQNKFMNIKGISKKEIQIIV